MSLILAAISTRDIILILVVLLVLGALTPAWPHSREWGYRPVSIVGVLLVILLILFLTGRL